MGRIIGELTLPDQATGKFFRDDGTWQTPAGGGGATITTNVGLPLANAQENL